MYKGIFTAISHIIHFTDTKITHLIIAHLIITHLIITPYFVLSTFVKFTYKFASGLLSPFLSNMYFTRIKRWFVVQKENSNTFEHLP